MDMNNTTFSGRLGRDAETKTTPSGATLTAWTIACDQGFGDNKTTLWIDCTMWGERGAKIERYLTKGKQVVVSGSVGIRQWTSKDGEAKAGMTLRVNDVSMVGGGGKGEQTVPTTQPTHDTQPAGQERFEDEIPF